ncbi:MAG: hypothetical protein EOP47_11435 [Sphingobacteriaceae bacterium]|nr:MAG: hypothetical protein EOP47_11435 [Sphingobacteriaceae bacterium]
MIKKTLATAFMVMVMTVISFAADITGNWKGTVMDQFEINYTFKVEGEKLSGSSKGPDGSDTPFKDGTIKGDDLEFTIDILGNPTKVKGKIKTDATDKTKETVTLTFKVMDNDVVLVLNRVVK